MDDIYCCCSAQKTSYIIKQVVIIKTLRSRETSQSGFLFLLSLLCGHEPEASRWRVVANFYSRRLGTSLSEQALLKYKNAFLNKTEVVEKTFTSTSRETNVYQRFQNLTKQEGDIPLIMFFNSKGKYAVEIDGLSRYGKNFIDLGGDLQDEVLYISGAKFKVTGYLEDVSANGQKYVKIIFDEIP